MRFSILLVFVVVFVVVVGHVVLRLPGVRPCSTVAAATAHPCCWLLSRAVPALEWPTQLELKFVTLGRLIGD
jgi:hypothetical protein